MMCLVLLCAIFALFSSTSSAAPKEQVPLLLHLSFNNSLKPAFANGSYKVSRPLPPKFSNKGKKGAGLLIGNKKKEKPSGVAYKAEGNIKGDKGSIEMWIKLLPYTEEPPRRTFLTTDTANVMIMGWGKYRRFDFNFYKTAPKKGVRRYLQPYIEPWQSDTWHHLLCTWNAAKGTLKMYIDGHLLEKMEFPAKALKLNGRKIIIGSDQEGAFPAGAVIDEVKIYAVDLSDAQALLAFNGKLSVSKRKIK